MAESKAELVCVTGGSGFIGSWIVRLLLHRGYTVHATVKNIDDENETKHLEAMEGAESSLRLFQMDLLHYDSIVAAVRGATGVFHVASPCFVGEARDPQRELLEPAVKGTINVLTAAKEVGVRRVVVTSSISAMITSPNCMVDVVGNENCWANEDYCRSNGLWYAVSKIQAEKAAWKFSEENGLDIVVVNPGTVLGPIIPSAINASMQLLLWLLQGTEVPEKHFMGFVDVRDVAIAHILVYEKAEAVGRHLCIESSSQYCDFAAKMAQLYPHYKLPKSVENTQSRQLKAKDASTKLIQLGLQFTSLDQIIKDSIHSLRSKGFLS